LQILEREVELSSSTGETVSLRYRIGQLWEKELKDLTRAVEAYRDVLKLDGGHEPTLVALDGLAHGEQEPVLAAQVLEPIFESAGEWERVTRTTAFAASSCCIGSPTTTSVTSTTRSTRSRRSPRR
jgi:hypothetical protein